MGFYIRKSFKAGPVRLNLSKSGLGASVGVKGLRVASGPRGSYIHAGRGGLYYRKSLGSRRSKSSSSRDTVSLLTVLVLIIIGIAVIRWFVNNPSVFLFFGGIAIAVTATVWFSKFSVKKKLRDYKEILDSYFLISSQKRDNFIEIKKLKNKLPKDDKSKSEVRNIEGNVYEGLLDRILDDKKITDEEKELIIEIEKIISLDDDSQIKIKKELFSLYYFDVIADRAITNEEIDTLNNLIKGLRIPKEKIRDELETVSEISRMQKLSFPLSPVQDISVKIQKSETAYYFSDGKVLSRKKAKKTSSTRYEYSVKRDGKFVVTDKRIFVVGEGTTAVKLSDILDVDVDLDNKMLVISKGTSSQPTLIQTQEPLYVGRIIDILIHC